MFILYLKKINEFKTKLNKINIKKKLLRVTISRLGAGKYKCKASLELKRGDGECDCIPTLTCHCLLLEASPLDRVGFAFSFIYSNNLIILFY